MKPELQRVARHALVVAIMAALPAVSAATDLTVRVLGTVAGPGEVGCALYSDARGFPMDTEPARTVWLRAGDGALECRFEGLTAGTYAVSVVHDSNGNRRVDTNFLGLPTEGWGVSRGARPALRAPRFDEASFAIGAQGAQSIEVRVGYP